jgi:short-subunit dehydrogenase
LLPRPTAPAFFVRADMPDTRVGRSTKLHADEVARLGFEAMLKGEGEVVTGWQNKLRAAIAKIAPSGAVAEQHRKMAEPGGARAK